MLLQFNFKNFKSFKDIACLDMRSTRVTELDYHIQVLNNNKILPITGVFGNNNSGKSNLIEAVSVMKKFVVESMLYNKNMPYQFLYNKQYLFMFNHDNDADGTMFETVLLLENGKKYIYGFVVTETGFKQEWLKEVKKSGKIINILIREDYELIELKSTDTSLLNIFKTSLKKTNLVLSLGASLNHSVLLDIYQWFTKVNIINNQTNSRLDENMQIMSCINDFSIYDTLLQVLRDIDGTDIQKIFMKGREIYLSRIVNNQTIEYPFILESDGFKKIVLLFYQVYNSLKNGEILFIDNLSDYVHQLIIRLLIIMFTDPENNINHSQLIFTSHNTYFLQNDLLRRDEIWFTEKSNNNISELFSLVEFKNADKTTVRKDLNYETNYLLGRFGAIPFSNTHSDISKYHI